MVQSFYIGLHEGFGRLFAILLLAVMQVPKDIRLIRKDAEVDVEA